MCIAFRIALQVMMFVGLQDCILSVNGVPAASRSYQQCGIVATETRAKIYGGKEVALGAFPWIAIIGYTAPNDRRKKWNCGGSLIASRWILTAAHCVDSRFLGNQIIAEVRLGEHRLDTTPDCQDFPIGRICAPQPQVFGVLNVFQHRDFSPSQISAANDIALIKLDGEVTYTDYVSPVCLPSPNFKPNQNTNGITAGWGKTEHNTKSKVLLSVSLPYFDHTTCSQKYDGGVSNSQLCFGGRANKDSCEGDSGGPLVVLDNNKQIYTLVGVVSYGHKCGQAGFPGIYTSVSYYLNWIQSIIRGKEKYTDSEAAEISTDANTESSVTDDTTENVETSTDAIHENVEDQDNTVADSDIDYTTENSVTDDTTENVETSTDAIHENIEDQDNTVIVNVACSSYVNCTVGSLIEENHENDLDKPTEILATSVSMFTPSTTNLLFESEINIQISLFESSTTSLVVESETHIPASVFTPSTTNFEVESVFTTTTSLVAESEIQIPTSVYISSTTSFAVESETHISTPVFSSSTTSIEVESKIPIPTTVLTSTTSLEVEATESMLNTEVLSQTTPLYISGEATKSETDKQSELHTIQIMSTTYQATTHTSSIFDCRYNYYLGGSTYILC